MYVKLKLNKSQHHIEGLFISLDALEYPHPSEKDIKLAGLVLCSLYQNSDLQFMPVVTSKVQSSLGSF